MSGVSALMGAYPFNSFIRLIFSMSNATVSRIGQINGAGAVDALFLKVFAGEVLTSFEQTNVMMDKHQVRTITNGKSA